MSALEMALWSVELALTSQFARGILNPNKGGAIAKQNCSRIPASAIFLNGGRKLAGVGQPEFSVAVVQQQGNLFVPQRRGDEHIQCVVAVYIARHDLQSAGR